MWHKDWGEFSPDVIHFEKQGRHLTYNLPFLNLPHAQGAILHRG